MEDLSLNEQPMVSLSQVIFWSKDPIIRVL